MIRYSLSSEGITEEMLGGFFVGWLNPPSRKKHLHILKSSTYVVVAIDDDSGNMVGFINAISDRVLSAYIPLLEVLPDYQKQGIGSELVRRMLEQLKSFYQVDLVCDAHLQQFYKRFGMIPGTGMMIRRFENTQDL